MSFFAAFLLLAAAFPIESIHVEGLKRLKLQQVVAASGLTVGEKADQADFDAAQARLMKTGVLGSVGYSYKPSASGRGYDLTFEVVEVDQVFPIRFEDLGKPDEELLRLLAASDPLFTDPAPGTEPVIKRYEAVLNAHLKANPPIVGRISVERPGQEAMLFRPNTPRPTVASVAFKGNQAFTAVELQNRLAAVAVGALYTEERFRELLANQIRPLYETRGLLRVAFPKITAAPASDVSGLHVEVEVVEGPEYTLDDVKLTGVAGASELLKIAAFKTGEVFRLNEIVEGLERLRAALRSQGYMKAATEATRQYQDGRKTVDMLVSVQRGPKYEMGKLEIKGLDLLTEPVIRKMWGLKAGEAFREGYPEKFLATIREQGLFDNLGETTARLDVDEPAKKVNVILEFAGKKKEPEKPKF